MAEHGDHGGAPSRLLIENLPALHDASRLGPILDLASGSGRHALACMGAGLRAIALDRRDGGLRELRERARAFGREAPCVRADLEGGAAIPLAPGRLGAVLVFRYLHRPLAPAIAALLAPGGLLLYETFTRAQRELGHGPKNPDFLLEPGELPRLFGELEVESYEELLEGAPRPDALARLVARKPRG